MLGHRAEKCRQNENGYYETVVKKYETQRRSTKKIREILSKLMDVIQPSLFNMWAPDSRVLRAKAL